MKRFNISILMVLLHLAAHAQQGKSTTQFDSLSFIRSKRISDKDLAKKKEGRFSTAIPDISSDPVTGVGFGLRSNTYWNGKRDNPLFAYTPYLVKMKANAAYYTSNAKELVLSFDVPYYKATRWRFKVDFKAQQNPANLYFGSSEHTLSLLRLPSSGNAGATYSTFSEYDKARKTLRAGQPGEAALVTDALSNRFRETEFMLNLKADYALGKGRWRLLGGYEIQHLSYTTFEGKEADAIDPNTGVKTKAPNGTSLLRRDNEQGLIYGLNGGWVSLLQTALIYDTRDLEPDPTKGAYFELANEFSNPVIGSNFSFNKLSIQGKIFKKIPIGPRTIIAGRFLAGNIFGDKAPFFEFQDQWSPDGSVNALGGKQSLRGFRANRFLARALWFSNVELRARVKETNFLKQHFSFSLVPFFDAGTVRDNWQDLNLTKIKYSYGAGIRVGWNQSTIISFDYGISKEDKLFFFGLGQAF